MHIFYYFRSVFWKVQKTKLNIVGLNQQNTIVFIFITINYIYNIVMGFVGLIVAIFYYDVLLIQINNHSEIELIDPLKLGNDIWGTILFLFKTILSLIVFFSDCNKSDKHEKLSINEV